MAERYQVRGGPYSAEGKRRNAAKDKARGSTSDGVNAGGKKKLTESDCKDIRKMSAQFKTQREIATKYGVKMELIRAVLRGTYIPRKDDDE